MEVKDRIKALREEKGVTITLLSKELNVSRFAIMKWEKGETKPTMEAQKKLCAYFNVTSDYLMCITNKRKVEIDPKEDKFLVDLSVYSQHLTTEQKELLLSLAKQVALSNSK